MFKRKLAVLLAAGMCMAVPVFAADSEPETVEDLFALSPETEADREENTAAQTNMSMGHGPLAAYETWEKCTFVYEGGTMGLDYRVEAKGFSECGVGFLVFLGGIAQPYSTPEEPECAYMHVFYPREIGEEQYKLEFIPVTGEKGDRLELTVASVSYPGLKLDMKEHGLFTPYHHVMESYSTLFLEEAPPDVEEGTGAVGIEGVLLAAEAGQEDLTVLQKKKFVAQNCWTEEDLKRIAGYRFIMDGTEMNMRQSYLIDDRDTVHVRLEVIGCPTAEYVATFYLDHEALSLDGETSFALPALEDGKMSVLEADLDVTELGENTTFYAVMALKEKDMEKSVYLLKTPSVAFYRSTLLSGGE